jgi:cyclopropane-fatty-acyl-phospholipid synthase
VIRDDLFERYAAGTDFIQQCIFPGGCLPSVSEFNKAANKRGLKVTQTFELGRDYAKTLALWRQAFLSRSQEVMALGFDDKFMRLWNFYLVYCEAAFVTGNTNVYQFTLEHSN